MACKGHETVGIVAALGKDVKGFEIGERVVADNSELCNECFYCRRGQLLLCENFNAHGVTMDGGFAEYCAYSAGKVFKIHNLSDVDATLLEPASCAAHGLEKIAPKMGSRMEAVMSSWLLLRVCFFLEAASEIFADKVLGLKMDLARKLDSADVYIELSRTNPEAQFQKLKAENPYGFDIVVEATGSPRILEDAINYVRRGGKLVVYGGSFSETYMFPTAINYLDSGKVKVGGIVNKTFKLEQWGECLESLKNKSAIKAAITFD
ncbi:hypothetical protein FGG08_001060 [Glutinoglossum americanum]|uniref:Uncharacterized protein n=1 Tax=Glutinoglossum americanum TaxID=1670608 RepID=A0A9P8I2Q5_9PEZI|nr:hypothetical protein FGG08_001060 [Glutinoglossum americanum]